ncbi:MAG: ATP-binding protein [Oculatellaceae cyanobacterium Prado106]|nr:ATP-binding protein [Oculatellaceae cyanobacterium Prado106]
MADSPSPAPKADILVIDDMPENLNLLAAMLMQQGYKVRSVTKGTTGLRGAQVAPPDLILLDINMPEMNGREVCQRLKADARTRDIPVIFISALGDVLDKVNAFAVGGVDYISKPFQVEEVLARIENHLTLRRLQRQLQAQNAQLQQEMLERQQAEEKFSKAFRLSPNPIAIATHSEGRLLDVNPSFLTMGGYPFDEVIGRTVDELGLFRSGEAMVPFSMQGWQSLVASAMPNQEAEFLTRSGSLKTILFSLEPIELVGMTCVLLMINDITERKRLENEFISLVSHELRTPLTSLMGSLDLLASGQLGHLTEQGQRVLQIATTNTDRLNRLVDDILDLERMRSGKIEIRRVPCQVSDLLQQAIDAMQSMADQAEISLILQAPDTSFDPTIEADPDRLLQMIINLLSNAIKFSSSGGRVWVRKQIVAPSQFVERGDGSAIASDGEIPGSVLSSVQSFSSDAPGLLIGVEDEGRGIPADMVQRIFERFQQVDALDSRRKGGTGLGLAICRNIVEQHGGRIWVESELGQGSRFWVWLPQRGETQMNTDGHR